MAKKINLLLLFGGRSCEHEVSLTSARSLCYAINKQHYAITLIGITKDGSWRLIDDIDNDVKSNIDINTGYAVSLTMGNPVQLKSDHPHQPNLSLPDVALPLLHGTYGEDGKIQGLLEMIDLPYIGCSVGASALAMDKVQAKQIFTSIGLKQAPHWTCKLAKWRKEQSTCLTEIEKTLHGNLFIKPANLGSSVGISKYHDLEQTDDRQRLVEAIEHAFQFDHKIVIEQSMVNCREVECAVLGNDEPQASVVGEIIPASEFYSYETKYIDAKSSTIIPADLPPSVSEEIQYQSLQAFAAIEGSGLARVDFFVDRSTYQITFNEINTMPGFTPISMYPKLWQETGLSYSELIDNLIEFALKRHRHHATLLTDYSLSTPLNKI